MSVVDHPTAAPFTTVAGLLDHLGVPPERILLRPPPGTATEKDVTELDDHHDRLCELIDGVLVEKTMGYVESMLSVEIILLIRQFTGEHDLGIVLGEAGTLRILPDQVRIPDVCFISWDRFPNRQMPDVPIPDLAPDLAVEVLSKSNTEREMDRKLGDYFAAGVRLVWYVDAASRTARAYRAVDKVEQIGEDGVLDGHDVLPGFTLSLAELFRRVPRPS